MLALANIMHTAPIRMTFAEDLSAILTDIGSVLTAMFSWISYVFTAVTSNPILFIMVVGTFGLVCIGIVRRLLKL